jgi:uncharacterized protein YecT (DUF1311 family)
MRAIFLALILLVLGPPSQALAQECDPSDESQTGMNICANADYKAADAKLNKAYGEIVKRLADDAESKKLLQKSQRDWIAFRDAECAFSTNDSKGGSIYPMLMSQCLAGLTAARTEQLSGYLNCQEGDLSCPLPPQ